MASISPPQDLNANKSARPLATAIVSIVISALFYSGRMYARYLTKQRLDSSDYLLLFGMIMAWGINANIIYCCTQGMGQHVAKLVETDPTLTGLRGFLQSLIAVDCLYCVSMSSVKISFLTFYRKIFPGRWFARITHITTGVILIWATVSFWLSIFHCTPVESSWDASLVATAECINPDHFDIGVWVPHIVTDVVIMCLPQWKVWQLHVGLKSKMIVALLFLLGGMNIIVSAFRFTTIFQVTWTDPTWTITTPAIWTCIELLAAVASACMPLLRPLFQKVVPKSWSLSLETPNQSAGSDRWYTTDRKGDLKRVNVSGSSSGRFFEDPYESLPEEETGQSFAMSNSFNPGTKIASESQEEGGRDIYDGILMTRSFSTQRT